MGDRSSLSVQQMGKRRSFVILQLIEPSFQNFGLFLCLSEAVADGLDDFGGRFVYEVGVAEPLGEAGDFGLNFVEVALKFGAEGGDIDNSGEGDEDLDGSGNASNGLGRWGGWGGNDGWISGRRLEEGGELGAVGGRQGNLLSGCGGGAEFVELAGQILAGVGTAQVAVSEPGAIANADQFEQGFKQGQAVECAEDGAEEFEDEQGQQQENECDRGFAIGSQSIEGFADCGGDWFFGSR